LRFPKQVCQFSQESLSHTTSPLGSIELLEKTPDALCPNFDLATSVKRRNAKTVPIKSKAHGSGTLVTLTTDSPPGALNTLSAPCELPSILKVKRESAPVGSVVVNSGNPVLGSSKNSEKASGKGPIPGAFVVASN
jgi:hypothetical protein